jgi:hypothetical protein
MRAIETPQTRCRAAIARCDITPPVGIYHRMWGAATHDRATGVHKPLLATLLWLEPESEDHSQALLLVALDHCILDHADIELIRGSVAAAAAVRPEQVFVTLSHTHAAGLMSRSRSHLPGGELIGPYLDEIAELCGALAGEALAARKPATIVYGQGRCNLAANRDYFDEERNQFVCGFNPSGKADDTVLVAMILDEYEALVATVVNYACHPTTLAWQNTQISPDYVGSLREVIERDLPAPCLFLQGASGDLGPRVGFVGDQPTADLNGFQLAHSALAALFSLPNSRGSQFVYAGPVVSGATIGTWHYQPLDQAAARRQSLWNVIQWKESLHYRPDLPSRAEAQAELDRLRQSEADALAGGQTALALECHARVEQATRQLWRLEALPPSSFPMRITLAHLGDAFWLFVPGEHYQFLQTTLRSRFPNQPIIVTTLTDGWQPGYIPPTDTYGRGIYQEKIAVVAAGSAEQVIESIAARIQSRIDAKRD